MSIVRRVAEAVILLAILVSGLRFNARPPERPRLNTVAAQAPPPANWTASAMNEIERIERLPSLQTADATAIPFDEPRAHFVNRGANLRTYVDTKGLEFRPRSDAHGDWSVLLALQEPKATSFRIDHDRVLISRGSTEEIVENRVDGIEHLFVLGAGPDAPLRLELRVTSTGVTSIRSTHDEVLFSTAAGDVLSYAGLVVTDACGRTLESAMTWDGEFIVLATLETGSYPITIDPIASQPAWTNESADPFARYGWSVAGAGDVNGDGFADVIVGAIYFDNGVSDSGMAFLYHGSANGLPVGPSWVFGGWQQSAHVGWSVASAGDVNGDGFSDVIIGAELHDNVYVDEGMVVAFHGSALGLSPTPQWTMYGGTATACFGVSIASAGDVNGDGYSDIIVGSHGYDSGQANEGRASAYYGGPSGLSATAAWTRESNQVEAHFGWTVAAAGDVNGDGYSDVLVGADLYDAGQFNEGAVWCYLGGPSGISLSATWLFQSNQANAQAGYSIAGIGDINGDGFGDVAVTAPWYDNGANDTGRVYVFYGTAVGLPALPSWTYDGAQAYDRVGRCVARGGDVNGDGFADMLLGVPYEDDGQVDEGVVHLFAGSATGLGASSTWSVASNQAASTFGWAVACAGDINGDGFSEIIIGAPLFDNDQVNEGRAFVYYGAATGLVTSNAWTQESNQADARMGWSVSSAGDVNGDGYADVIVGAPYFDNGQSNEGRAFVFLGSPVGTVSAAAWTAESNVASALFGSRVTAAGDVNGDGYDDIAVGAPNLKNGQTQEGRVYVYHGSPAGPAAVASWTYESNKADANFGSAIASGDVNGDGLSDLVIGARRYKNGQTAEGRVYLFAGSATGLGSTPLWTVESNKTDAQLGYAVAVGNVNGDGFADILAGAPFYDNPQDEEGRAFCYHGAASGPSSTANWSAESNQNKARFGLSVAFADVNGDGRADAIVGAPYYDNGQSNEGRAFAYYGSATGLAATAGWTAESNQSDALMGFSVASAGDFNGDGYGDIVIGIPLYDNGQTNEGRATVYSGSAAGLSAAPSLTLESNASSARLGYSVSSAGDVNWDGYSDLILGAPYYSSGQTSEGKAYVTLGSP